MLFRWFLDLNIRGGSFDQSTFAKNRTRLLAHAVTGQFFGAVVSEARRERLLPKEHFSVDGTLLEAWASLKSVRPRDEERDPPAGAGGRNPWKDFRGERRSNATHVSTTDPEALLARKGQGQAANRRRGGGHRDLRAWTDGITEWHTRAGRRLAAVVDEPPGRRPVSS